MTREIFCDFTLMCAHRLPNLPASHPCARLHGHNYRVRLYVSGPMDYDIGWIIDYADIGAIWRDVVHSRLDHRCLNDLEVLSNPTCELLAEWIYLAMDDALRARGHHVSRIEVQEEPGSGVVLTP